MASEAMTEDPLALEDDEAGFILELTPWGTFLIQAHPVVMELITNLGAALSFVIDNPREAKLATEIDRLRAENARMRDPSAIAATIAKLTDDERREVNLALLTTSRIIMDSSAARAGYDELADRVRALGDENARLTADLESSERYAADLESVGIGDLLRKGQEPSDVANAARLSVENEVLRRENAELRERAKALEMHLENVLTVARPVTARDKHICEEAVYVWEGYARPAKEGR